MKLKFLDTIQTAYDNAQPLEVEIDELDVIIFSDHHRGSGDRADDYRFASSTYETALAHYQQKGSTLVLLGDVEELWENSPRDVLEFYNEITKKEFQFEQAAKYLRIWGNHDSDWANQKAVQKHLKMSRPVHEAVRVKIRDKKEFLGTIFLIHGHQGSTFSDEYARLSKFFVRFFWRYFQRIFNKPLDTAATSSRMRSKHDMQYYSWAREHNHNLIVITGHTHEPVFNSFTYADRLRVDHARFETKAIGEGLTKEEQEQFEEVKKRINVLKKHDATHLNPLGHAVPCYFNTGCCSFSDGEITGIELADREIRLIKWTAGGNRKIIQKESIRRIFELLQLDSKIITEGITDQD